jgi:hypothetical protein
LARIRSIKPDFWTDENLADCSLNARLLFIGTWNVADDDGNLERSARQLKAQIFPYDNIDCEPLVQELLTIGRLIEYEVDGKKFLHIKNFAKHQKIDHKSKPRCPLYEDSASPPRDIEEESPMKGGEGRGEELNISLVPHGTPECPHDDIIAVYHELLPNAPRVRMWTEKRRKALRSRWRENAKHYATVDEGLTWWRKFFGYVAQSDFLTGRAQSNGRPPFIASLEWLTKSENFVKTIEGNYHA